VAKILVDYLRPIRRKLSRLVIHDHTLTLTEVEKIVSVFDGKESHLRSLEMHTYFLNSDLLNLLSRKLPELNCLEFSVTNKDNGSSVAHQSRNWRLKNNVRLLVGFVPPKQRVNN
jgi:hypothetical protein